MVRRRKFIRIISYFAAACIVFASAGVFSGHAKAEYEEALEKIRLTSLVSLCEYCHYISSGLRLLAVSADDALESSSSLVVSNAMGAQGCLAAFDSEKVKNISRFINGAYEFAESFSGSEAERSAAKRLSEYAREIYYHLSDLSAGVLGGVYSLTEFGSIYFSDEKPSVEEYLDFSNGTEDEIFALITPAAADYGGFALLDGKEHISEKQARKIASGYIKITPALWRENDAHGQDSGVYSYYHGDTAVEICKQGGILCRLINPLPCAKAEFTLLQAEEKAREFLAKCGFKDCVSVDAQKSEFTAAFVFAPRVNGVLLLTASAEINVCLATGEITFFDGSDFIRNYRNDIYADTEIPDFSDRLPSNLSIEKTDICYADIGGKEQICYIADCVFEGEYVRAYVDYNTYKILKVE